MTSKTRNNFYLIFIIFITFSTDSLIFSYNTEIERKKMIPYFSFLFDRSQGKGFETHLLINAVLFIPDPESKRFRIRIKEFISFFKRKNCV
jgi:hypothetical protein